MKINEINELIEEYHAINEKANATYINIKERSNEISRDELESLSYEDLTAFKEKTMYMFDNSTTAIINEVHLNKHKALYPEEYGEHSHAALKEKDFISEKEKPIADEALMKSEENIFIFSMKTFIRELIRKKK